VAPQKKEAVIEAQISGARCELACQKGAQHTTTARATPATVASFPVKQRRRSSSGDRGGRMVAFSPALDRRRNSRGSSRGSRRDAKRHPPLLQTSASIGRRPLDRRLRDRWSTGRLADRRRLVWLHDRRPYFDDRLTRFVALNART
jgi:hypothetical protein